MRYSLLIFIACLLIVGSAGAVANYRLSTTINLQELTDVSCSQDSYSPSPNSSIIWIVWVNGFGDTRIDGQVSMPMGNQTLGGKPGWQYPVKAGTHTVRIAKPGYTDYSAKVAVCDYKVTYVYYDQPAHLITTTTTVPVTTTVTQTKTSTLPVTTVSTAPTGTQQDTLGSLSVTTTPAGAFIFIDGVQRGVTPGTIPGLSAGTHTLFLKLDGYQDLSTPVTIAAGKTQDYSSGMAKIAAAAPATTETVGTTATPKKSPGFEFALALMAMGAVIALRKLS